MRWIVWLAFGCLVTAGLFAAIAAADAPSLRDIVRESEGGAIPDRDTWQRRAVQGGVALPWQTIEELSLDFRGDLRNPICTDMEDSYASLVVHDGVTWFWFWGNARFVLTQFGPDRALAHVYEGRVDAGHLIVDHTIPIDQLTPQSTPCAWFRAT